ncbi:MAG: hypothetical protein LQ350_004062 [Teloschistes chrysophthalmus]|nr:MAG: hypothetical protein LQ350_004062 [Niorma chrysophthalma]
MGTADRPGPRIIRRGGQTFLEALDLMRAASAEGTRSSGSQGATVRTAAIRLGGSLVSKISDDDTDDEEEEESTMNVSAARTEWPRNIDKGALQKKAEAEGTFPGVKNVRQGSYAQRNVKEPAVRVQETDQDVAMTDAPKSILKRESEKEIPNLQKKLGRRKLETLLGSVNPDQVFEQVLDQATGVSLRELLALSPDLRKQLYKREQPNSEGDAGLLSVKAVTARVNRARLDSCTHAADEDWFAVGCPEVTAEVNGQTLLKGIVDSGSEINVIGARQARTAGLSWMEEPVMSMLGVTGGVRKFLGVCRAAPINIGGAVREVPVFVVEECDYELILGRVYIRKARLRMDNLDDGSCDISILGENGVTVRIRAALPDNPGNRTIHEVFGRHLKE